MAGLAANSDEGVGNVVCLSWVGRVEVGGRLVVVEEKEGGKEEGWWEGGAVVNGSGGWTEPRRRREAAYWGSKGSGVGARLGIAGVSCV